MRITLRQQMAGQPPAEHGEETAKDQADQGSRGQYDQVHDEGSSKGSECPYREQVSCQLEHGLNLLLNR